VTSVGRVLVAGGTGFIGAAIARRLREQGADVVVASRAAGVDLTDWAAVAGIGRIAAIVHAAGSTAVAASFAAPRAFHRDHFLVTLNLLELARVSGARVVLASTYVYGRTPPVPVAEGHATAAHSPYAASRLLAERLAADYHRDFGVAVDVLRIFNAYGPGQPQAFVVPKIVAGAVAGRIALADPAPRRDFVHVDDVARAFAVAALRSASGCDVFNIGSGESRAVDAVARAAARLAGGAVEITYSGVVRTDEIPDARADVAKAARVLGWRATVDFEAGLAALVAAAKGAPA
jgi:nucleoside-diphosphate-sugar epimerase